MKKETVEEQIDRNRDDFETIESALKESQQSFELSKEFSRALLEVTVCHLPMKEIAEIANTAIVVSKGIIKKGENNDKQSSTDRTFDKGY